MGRFTFKAAFFILLNLGWAAETLAQGLHFSPPTAWLGSAAADWVGPKEQTGTQGTVLHFCQNIELKSLPDSFVVNVSADRQYHFWVNGTWVGTGPQVSKPDHWYFDKYDLKPYLKQGQNLLAVWVWSYAGLAAENWPSAKPGLWFQPNGPTELTAISKTGWRMRQDTSVHFSEPGKDARGHYMAPPAWHHGSLPDRALWYKDAAVSEAWPQATWNAKALYASIFWYDQWRLLNPADLPRQKNVTAALPTMVASHKLTTGPQKGGSFLGLTIGRQQKVSWLLDQKQYMTGRMLWTTQGGKGAKLTVRYAESLYLEEKYQNPRGENKGHRDSTNNKVFVGLADRWQVSGLAGQELFTPDWRAWRYVLVEVETQKEPLTIMGWQIFETGYPFTKTATWEAGGRKDLDAVLTTGWRTAQACAASSYMDCPYYEQQQYIGDTRIQAIVSYYNSGDARLAKKALLDAARTQNHEGMLLSRYPAKLTQFIPGFSLWWIGMLHDYGRHTADTATVQQLLPTAQSIIRFYTQRLKQDAKGQLYLAQQPYWPFVDWVPGKWIAGMPPVDSLGGSAVHDLQFLVALQYHHELQKASNAMPTAAGETSMLMAQLAQSIQNRYWNPELGLYKDNISGSTYSEHAQILALLAGIVKLDQVLSLAQRLRKPDEKLAPVSIYFQYYKQEALAKAGLAEHYSSTENLKPWLDQLALGLTTWAEEPEPSRSDCHAWGASPNIHLYKYVLGVQPAAWSYKQVKIAPHLGQIKKLKGIVPHPAGSIEVSYQVKKRTTEADIILPIGITGSLKWKGKDYPLNGGRQILTLQ